MVALWPVDFTVLFGLVNIPHVVRTGGVEADDQAVVPLTRRGRQNPRVPGRSWIGVMSELCMAGVACCPGGAAAQACMPSRLP